MVFTLILLACELAVGVWSIILWDDIPIASIDLITKSFDNFDTNKKQWNKLQTKVRFMKVFYCKSFNRQRGRAV